MTLTAHLEEVAQGCRCVPASEPFDQWVRVNPACLLHGGQPVEIFDLDAAAERLESVSKSPMAVFSLCEAGWVRGESGWWTHPTSKNVSGSLNQAQAYAMLLWEDGNIS